MGVFLFINIGNSVSFRVLVFEVLGYFIFY